MDEKKLDNLIQNYYDNYNNYIVVPDILKNRISNTMYVENKFNIIILIKKIIITILSIVTLSGGLVIAKNYLFTKFDMGEGINKAIQEGYIYRPEENKNTEQIILNSNNPDLKFNISINEFLMDDRNISTSFLINYENIELNNIRNIKLEDLIITDEENKILYCVNEEAFNKFCNENCLNYKFSETNDNYFTSGVNNFIQPSTNINEKKLIYNIFLGGLDSNYPKSKKLNYKFTSISLMDNDYNESMNIKGYWNLSIDVPEKMYKRKDISYKVKSCSNNNIDVLTAKGSDTGFELHCILNNIEIPEKVREYRRSLKMYLNNEISYEKWQRIYVEYEQSDLSLPPIRSYYEPELGETIEDCTYIENEKGEKFLISDNPGRKQNKNFIDDNTFNVYETFDLTKYDITNELKIHIVFYDNVYTIVIERI